MGEIGAKKNLYLGNFVLRSLFCYVCKTSSWYVVLS